MIELLGWIGLAISLALMIYHHYMLSNYDQVYEYISNKYEKKIGDTKLPSKEDHSRSAEKYSMYTAFFAGMLITLSLFK
ncbi:MAG: hypothetical protein LZF61_09075 [Nitrosomonas sp.]|nr:MAG: hypothetical protein LZF61_09075 [Nitrosomonas sp.]